MNSLKHKFPLLALALAALVATAPAAAQTAATKPAARSVDYGVKLGAFFNDQQKSRVRKAFSQHYAKGNECPPGMERNEARHCAPPVAGHYWAVGQPLQAAVEAHPLPPAIESQMPPAPEGYEYTLAGGDVLMISKAIKLVVDIIPDVMS